LVTLEKSTIGLPEKKALPTPMVVIVHFFQGRHCNCILKPCNELPEWFWGVFSTRLYGDLPGEQDVQK